MVYSPTVYVKGFSLYDIEYIIREGDTAYRITFHNQGKEISYMTKAKYENGLIKSYSGECYTLKRMASLYHEEYFYTESLLTKAIVYFNILPEFNCYTENKYTFEYNDNEKICGYIDASD